MKLDTEARKANWVASCDRATVAILRRERRELKLRVAELEGRVRELTREKEILREDLKEKPAGWTLAELARIRAMAARIEPNE